MKILPCSTCNGPAQATRDGALQTAGSCPDSTLRYLCRRCGRQTTLTAAEFVRLPDMSEAELITHFPAAS